MVVADHEVLARVGRDAVLGTEAPVEVNAVVVAVLAAVVEPDAVAVLYFVSLHSRTSLCIRTHHRCRDTGWSRRS